MLARIIPQDNRRVPASGSQRCAIERKGHACDEAGMPLKEIAHLAGGDFPDFDDGFGQRLGLAEGGIVSW